MTCGNSLYEVPAEELAFRPAAEQFHGARVGVGEALRNVEREEAVGHPRHRFLQAIVCGHRFAPSEHDLTQSQPARSCALVAWRYHANHLETVANAALAGLGSALLPGICAAPRWPMAASCACCQPGHRRPASAHRIIALAPPERMRVRRNQVLLAFLRQQLGT